MRMMRLLVATTFLAGILAVSGLAGAHAERVQFTPGPDAVVATAPAYLSLAFTEPFTALTVEVYDAQGQAVVAGRPVLDAEDRTVAVQPLLANLPAGSYTVKWSATSVDGHTSTGRYLYHVTAAQPGDQAQLFWNGKPVAGDVPAQIIDGRVMVPVRALAESLGLIARWDAAQRFVTVSPAPAMGHGHGAPYVQPAESPVPTVEVIAHKDAKAGYVIQVKTTNWTWAPLHANSAAVPNEGHAHLYLDGVKINRLYGEWYQLDAVDSGYHEITVTLNANDHSEYALPGEAGPVVVSQTVTVLGGKAAAGMGDHGAGMDEHGDGMDEHGTGMGHEGSGH